MTQFQRLTIALGAVLLLSAAANAQDEAELPSLPTYGTPEDKIIVTAVRLTHPKNSADRTEGGPNHVLFSLWVPEDLKTVRGIYLHPFNLSGVEQQQSRAMCRHWGFGLVGGNFMRVKKDEFAPSLVTGLNDLAKQSGHAEIAHAPLIMASMSAGVGMCVTLAEQIPERTIACALACLEVGPETERTRDVPMLSIFGERDGMQMMLHEALLPKRRAEFDAQWGITPQWGRRHEWGQSNNLFWPFFDEVIRQRLPDDASPVDGPIALRPCNPGHAWLADPTTWKSRLATVAPAVEYVGDKAVSCWLPGEDTAHVWQAFVVKNPLLKITQPLPQGDKEPLTIYTPADEIVVRVDCDTGFNGTNLALYDRGTPIGKAAVIGGKCEFMVDTLTPGIHTFITRGAAADGHVELSRPVTVLVVAAETSYTHSNLK